jgi:hypothetical protein
MDEATIGEANEALMNIENETGVSLAYLRGSLPTLSKWALAEIVKLSCEV